MECLNYSSQGVVHSDFFFKHRMEWDSILQVLWVQQRDKLNLDNIRLFWPDKDAQAVHTMASISKQVFLKAIHFNTLRERIFMGESIYRRNGHTFDFTIYAGLERHSQIRVFIWWTELRECIDSALVTGNNNHLENVLVLRQHKKKHPR